MSKPHPLMDRMPKYHGRPVYQGDLEKTDQPTNYYVPTIRIFGSTKSGQKACLHVHQLYPYFAIPYDGSMNKPDLERFVLNLEAGLDVALRMAHGANVDNAYLRKYVLAIIPFKGIPFYGYHVGYRYFLKIYLYNPTDIKKAAGILSSGGVMGQRFRAYEAHLPYQSQFMIDFNLLGMDFIDLSDARFRSPFLVTPHLRVHDDSEQHFTEQSIPERLKWPTLSKVARQSHCELELDCWPMDILNRSRVLERPYTALIGGDGTRYNADTKIVPSLATLWEEEEKRLKKMNHPGPLLKPSTDIRDEQQEGWFNYERDLDAIKKVLLDRGIDENQSQTYMEQVSRFQDDKVITAYTAIIALYLPENQLDFDEPLEQYPDRGLVDEQIIQVKDFFQKLSKLKQTQASAFGNEETEEEDLEHNSDDEEIVLNQDHFRDSEQALPETGTKLDDKDPTFNLADQSQGDEVSSEYNFDITELLIQMDRSQGSSSKENITQLDGYADVDDVITDKDTLKSLMTPSNKKNVQCIDTLKKISSRDNFDIADFFQVERNQRTFSPQIVSRCATVAEQPHDAEEHISQLLLRAEQRHHQNKSVKAILQYDGDKGVSRSNKRKRTTSPELLRSRQAPRLDIDRPLSSFTMFKHYEAELKEFGLQSTDANVREERRLKELEELERRDRFDWSPNLWSPGRRQSTLIGLLDPDSPTDAKSFEALSSKLLLPTGGTPASVLNISANTPRHDSFRSSAETPARASLKSSATTPAKESQKSKRSVTFAKDSQTSDPSTNRTPRMPIPNVFRYEIPPPTSKHLRSTLHKYGFPEVAYQGPFFSNAKDFPTKVQELSGEIFDYRKADTVEHDEIDFRIEVNEKGRKYIPYHR
ncbi:DNA polymerase zeta [Phlyctochytrium planicorne]|nr:DNA polymerase zeta [Phlyctochytrium planicorne]